MVHSCKKIHRVKNIKIICLALMTDLHILVRLIFFKSGDVFSGGVWGGGVIIVVFFLFFFQGFFFSTIRIIL